MTTEKYSLKTPLNKELFIQFLNDEMTVKQVKSFTEDLTKRFYYIVHTIAQLTGRTIDWFDYDNEGGEYNPGVFDTEVYRDCVGYLGEFSNKKDMKVRFEDYDDSFPTRWFYNNFEDELKSEQSAFFKEEEEKNNEKNAKLLKNKQDFTKIQNSIKAKLTKEEMAYIRFATHEEVRKNKAQQVKSQGTEVAKFIKEMKKLDFNISEQYQKYREGKKKVKTFDVWVLDNMDKLKKLSQKDKTLPPIACWPFKPE